MKKEFDSIQLIERTTDWKKLPEGNVYLSLKDGASIFVYFETAKYKLLKFKKDQSFQVVGNFIIYDELTVSEEYI